jgi:carbon-monoxide dehydrogenase small subunit
MMYHISLTVNGEIYDLQVDPRRRLVDVIREEIGLTGTKKSCGNGDCGACSVILDGRLVNSCLVLAVDANGKSVMTIEGLASGGTLHPLQKAFVEHGAIQCGFCTPGMIMSAKAFLDKNPEPTREEVQLGLGGNLCRCTGYAKILEAVAVAAKELK